MAELVDAYDSKSYGAIHGSSILPPGTDPIRRSKPRKMKPDILVILGPTASGKSDLAVQAALKYDGEVISADSRQIYKGLDIGTGKITGAEMRGVPHHLLDIADPRERFSAARWKKLAEEKIKEIIGRGKLPIICGGTGFYISALTDDMSFPDIPEDTELQKHLESQPLTELFRELKQLDPERAGAMSNNGESQNRRRIVRAIMVARKFGRVPKNASGYGIRKKYNFYIYGIRIPDGELKDRIGERLKKRIAAGMIAEAENLFKNGLTLERMDELGLEYRYLAKHIIGELTEAKMTEILSVKIWQYARRQKTWFRRDSRIVWISPDIDKIIIK